MGHTSGSLRSGKNNRLHNKLILSKKNEKYGLRLIDL